MGLSSLSNSLFHIPYPLYTKNFSSKKPHKSTVWLTFLNCHNSHSQNTSHIRLSINPYTYHASKYQKKHVCNEDRHTFPLSVYIHQCCCFFFQVFLLLNTFRVTFTRQLNFRSGEMALVSPEGGIEIDPVLSHSRLASNTQFEAQTSLLLRHVHYWGIWHLPPRDPKSVTVGYRLFLIN